MILVIGEALIDLIEDRNQPGQFQAIVGGANANVAIALARRGVPHQFLARLSRDRFGGIIRARLDANRVSLDHAISTDELTTLAVVSLDKAGVASYSFYVEGTADWGWTPAELPSDLELENMHVTALQFGCLTMAMPPGSAVIEEWARSHFEQRSMTISHDVNMRPSLGFTVDIERARVERLNQISHLIKASDDDIRWLYQLGDNPSEASLDEVARAWVAGSERCLFLTRGSEGVWIYRDGRERLAVPSRRVSVIDTVGAGDTFCGNLMGQLSELGLLGSDPFDRISGMSDRDLIEVTYQAGIAASMACERQGAEPPTKAELLAQLASLV